MKARPISQLTEEERMCLNCQLPDCDSNSDSCAVHQARRERRRADTAYRKARKAILSDAQQAAK